MAEGFWLIALIGTLVYSLTMRSVGHLILFLALFGTALPAIQGCSSAPIDENDPVSMMKDAENDIESDHYQFALEKLRAIKNRFPYSKQAVDAQLRVADVYFMQESFGEAALAYEAFKDLHPKHEKTPYAMYRQALSHYKDIPSTVARDMTAAKQAQVAYEAFLQRFPNAPEAVEGKKQIAEIRQKLAEKENYIGFFYFRREYFKTAKTRYDKTLELYPDTDAAKEAKDKLVAINQAIKEGRGEDGKDGGTKVPASGVRNDAPPSVFAPGSSTP